MISPDRNKIDFLAESRLGLTQTLTDFAKMLVLECFID